MNKKKMLAGAGAGVVVVSLLAFQVYNGNLKLPSAVTSLWSHKAAGPMARNFPSASAAPDLMVAPPAPPDTPPGSPPDSPPDSPPVANGSESMSTANGELVSANMGSTSAMGTGAQANSGEDVNARIGIAMELSKVLVNSAGTVPGPAKVAKSTATPSAPTPAGAAAYAGEWSGQFLGPDAGTVAIQVSEAGFVEGRGVSSITGIGFSLNGKVANNGKLDLVQTATGGTSTGATFSGTLSKVGRASGTWTMAAYNMSGTWELMVNAGQ